MMYRDAPLGTSGSGARSHAGDLRSGDWLLRTGGCHANADPGGRRYGRGGMTDAPAASTEPSRPPDQLADGALLQEPLASSEVRKEAYTMGLYVAICLLGALIALPSGR